MCSLSFARPRTLARPTRQVLPMPERFLTNPDSRDDACEVLARRALGAALNRSWSTNADTDERSFRSVDASTASGAVAILLERVPCGPERDEAVEILRRSVRAEGESDAST
jgi:hypothetical protein